MKMFIACLLIYHMELSWGWYIIVGIILMLDGFAHLWHEENSYVARYLRAIKN